VRPGCSSAAVALLFCAVAEAFRACVRAPGWDAPEPDHARAAARRTFDAAASRCRS